MKFTVNSKAFLSELALCMPAIESRTTSPIAGMVQLKINRANAILCAANLDYAVKTRLSIDSDQETQIILPVTNLYDWLSKVPDGELAVSVEKGFTARMGKLTCSVKFPETISYPDFPELGKITAQVPAGSLAPMFQRAAIVMSGGVSQQHGLTLDGSHLVLKDGVLSLSSTNGYRMARSTVEVSGANFQALVNKKFVSEVGRLAARVDSELPVSIYSGDNHTYFVFKDKLLYARSLAGRFPDLQRVFDLIREPKTVSFDAGEALESLIRVAAFSDIASRRVHFEANGQLRFSANSEAGDGDDSIDAEYSGSDKAEVNMNSSHVIDFLRLVSGKVQMQIAGPKVPVGFHAVDDPKFQYCVATMD